MHSATKSMAPLLQPMGKSVPPVLTYIDKGLGASILKAGLRLWDGQTEKCCCSNQDSAAQPLPPYGFNS